MKYKEILLRPEMNLRGVTMKHGRFVVFIRHDSAEIQGGSVAVPAANGFSPQHRSRSTWDLVFRLIGPILLLNSRHLP
jgi:hypothetical protein